jgi:hypothetical protein
MTKLYLFLLVGLRKKFMKNTVSAPELPEIIVFIAAVPKATFFPSALIPRELPALKKIQHVQS